MDNNVMADIVEWDCINWARAIKYWDDSLLGDFGDMHSKKVLDIGGRNGGLSLYWALRGADVECTDLNFEALERAQSLHKKYNIEGRIKYSTLDIKELTVEDKYDVVTFKSVMGAVGENNNYANQEKMMRNCYRALKPGGFLCFVENLTGSGMHMWLRKKYRPWGKSWRYVTIDELKSLLADFSDIDMNSFGFLGILGREKCFDICSRLDSMFDPLLSVSNKYIASCVAKK